MNALERMRWLSENPDVAEIIVTAREATQLATALDACIALWTQGHNNSDEVHAAAWKAVDVSLEPFLPRRRYGRCGTCGGDFAGGFRGCSCEVRHV